MNHEIVYDERSAKPKDWKRFKRLVGDETYGLVKKSGMSLVRGKFDDDSTYYELIENGREIYFNDVSAAGCKEVIVSFDKTKRRNLFNIGHRYYNGDRLEPGTLAFLRNLGKMVVAINPETKITIKPADSQRERIYRRYFEKSGRAVNIVPAGRKGKT
jgi:hypothetical protein